jgi:hypothetical protein
MLYGLKGLAALSIYLFWCVLREETLRVLSREGVACGKTVECRVG